MKKSICAVVVTYNRKELLLRCLISLAKQTHPIDHIIVVNNASTDGTLEFLGHNNWRTNDKFTLINLNENLGGAGGFFEGIKYAYENSFDYVWLMDDDGFPSQDCLEKLSLYISENCYIGPVVIDDNMKDKLSFSLRIPNTSKVYDSYSDLLSKINTNFIHKAILPFNGTLISRNIINKIGFPKKEFFIWGDEKDYTFSAIKIKANVGTVLNAKFYHPTASSNSTPMFFKKLRFNNANSDLKLYCFCRNSIRIFLDHCSIYHATAFFIKTTWFFLFTHPSFNRLLFCWRAMFHGITRNFNQHKEYIKK